MGYIAANKIEVQQTLHGYVGGHRLINASVNLPIPAQRTLVILSDLSGHTTVSGFEAYYTGYPIPGMDFYALARTWYAPEMERPGCVWTHSLLIRNADLYKVGDCRVFQQLFLRPRLNAQPIEYGTPLTLDCQKELQQPTFDATLAVGVLRGLYGVADRAVLVPCAAATEVDDLFFCVWSQQWPTLRRQFTFCTGSLAARTLGDTSFDLQAIPNRLVREIRREVDKVYIVGDDAAQLTPTPEGGWLESAAIDVQTVGHSELRRFLYAAAEPTGGREFLAPLVEAQQFALFLDGSADNFGKLLDALAQRFPAPAEGGKLKRILLGTEQMPSLPLSIPTEIVILRTLAVTRASASFDSNSLQLRDRASRLWLGQADGALELLLSLSRASLNTIGEEILHGLIAAIGRDEIETIRQKAERILPTIVSVRPSLAAEAGVWQVTPGRQREIVDALAAVSPSGIGKDVVYAAISVGAEAAADGLAHLAGDAAVTAVLDWADGSGNAKVELVRGNRWTRLLAGRPDAVLSWLSSRDSLRAETLTLTANVLNPHSDNVHSLGSQFWLRLMEATFGELTLSFRSFCMAIALANSGAGSDELVARSFDTLHAAAARDDLQYEDWQMFQRELPTLSWWQAWDRCERLRRGIILAFLRYGWSASMLLRCTSDEAVFAALIRSAAEVKHGKRLFRHLADEVRANHIIAPEPQRSLLLRSM